MQNFDLRNVAALGFDMFPVLNELRERDPIHWDAAARCWVVTRHADVIDGFSGRLPLSNQRFDAATLSCIPMDEWPKRLPNMMRYAPFHITNMDPPNHTRLRKLMTKAFSKDVAESMRPYARERSRMLVESLRGGETVDFTQDIARALPGHVLLKLLQFPEELYPHLNRWAHVVMVGFGTPNPKAEWVEAADAAFQEITDHSLVQIADRRKNPRGKDDFITALVSARDGQVGLTDDEVVALLETTLVAGHDTTTNSMALGVAALARHPDAWAYMKRNPDKILDCVLEIMRYSSMASAQNRAVAQDFEWHGKQLKKGDVVFLMTAGGNRDPRVFSDPEKLDLTRNNEASLTFAPGLHHCVGHLLAKVQLTEFFLALTQELHGAEILERELKFSPILVFRSIPNLRMRFH